MNKRISIDPNICHGKPIIKNTRVLVSNILADLADGSSFDDVVVNYPNISREDIKGAIIFSSELAQFKTIPFDKKEL